MLCYEANGGCSISGVLGRLRGPSGPREAGGDKCHVNADQPCKLMVGLVTWRTHCIDCGAELTTMSTAKGWEQLHAKRCKPCVTRLNKG